jgi:kinesin family protein C2/C3
VATTDAEGAYRQIVVTRRERRGDDARLLRRSFSFDRAFGPDASQAEVYAECGSLIRCVADGYNVCLLAYGQTGSGKTHTMSGPTNDFLNGFSFSDGDGDGDGEERALGVNYRALDDVFRTTRARDAVATHVVTVSVLEIYNEECRDLLAKRGGHKIDVSGFGAESLNASWVERVADENEKPSPAPITSRTPSRASSATPTTCTRRCARVKRTARPARPR